MKTTFRKLALVLAASAAFGTAQAGVLTWQDVVFTTTWADNELTVEIDAAKRSGDWSDASLLTALGIKGGGAFTDVAFTSGPAGTGAWTLSSHELNANGCEGGPAKPDEPGKADKPGKSDKATKSAKPDAADKPGKPGNEEKARDGSVLCLAGAPIALTNDMVFTFAFAGAPDLDQPHLKVLFLDSAMNKEGDLLSKAITGTAAGTPAGEVPEPQTVALLFAGLGLMGLALRKRG